MADRNLKRRITYGFFLLPPWWSQHHSHLFHTSWECTLKHKRKDHLPKKLPTKSPWCLPTPLSDPQESKVTSGATEYFYQNPSVGLKQTHWCCRAYLALGAKDAPWLVRLCWRHLYIRTCEKTDGKKGKMSASKCSSTSVLNYITGLRKMIFSDFPLPALF